MGNFPFSFQMKDCPITIADGSGLYSTHHFCFDKTLCMTWSRYTLSQDYINKSHSTALGFGLQTEDFLNEAINIDFDQEAAKISEFKAGI